MIKIDLGRTPEERVKSRKSEKKSVSSPRVPFKVNQGELSGLLFLGGVLAFSILPSLFVGQFKQRALQKIGADQRELQEIRANLEREIEKYQSYRTELENFEKQSALINQRLSSVNELLQSRGGAVNVLDAVGQALPPGAWLNQIELNTSPEANISFGGSAFTNEEVTEYSEKLGASIYLEKIQLKELTGSRTEKGDDLKSFSFSAIAKGFGVKAEKDRDTAGAPTTKK